MKRRALFPLTGCVVVGFAQPAIAQTQRVMHIGVLASYPALGAKEFDLAMSQRGWDGSNLIAEYRYTRGDDRLLPSLAKELVDMRVDMIFAFGDIEALAALSATRSIPIVALMTFPIELGIAKSLARPGGNVTGMAYQAQEFTGKQVEIFRAIKPSLRRLGITAGDNMLGRAFFASWQAPAEKAGISLVKLSYPARAADVEQTLAMAKRERVEAVEFTLNLALRGAGWQQITAWAIENKVLTGGAATARSEAAVAFGPNPSSFINQLAGLVDRILRGAIPGETPIQRPTVFDIVINRKIIQAMGLTVPRSVLLQATEVID